MSPTTQMPFFEGDAMSVVMQVYLSPERMVTPDHWAAAIRDHGFQMQLDTDFDTRTFTGFLPCSYSGQYAGFEYFFEPVPADAQLGGRTREAIGDRNAVVSFVTHSEFRDLMTSVIASGVLCALTDGVLHDTEADEFTTSDAALAWAREGERQISDDLRE